MEEDSFLKMTGAVRARAVKAAKDAARKEAYEIRHATRAATMRIRALPNDVGSIAKRALPEEDGSDGDGIDVRAPRYTPHNNIP
jgi:hypothetical protein